MLQTSRTSLLSNTSGNVVLMVAFISVVAMGFFIFLTSNIMRVLGQTENIRNAQIANFAAESTLEQSLVEYFQNPNDTAPTIIDETRDICTSSTNASESAIEFFDCAGGDKIGSITRNVTRYKDSIQSFVNRFETQEWWFTTNENEEILTIENLKNIRLEWNTSESISESAGIEITVARWPKITPRDIQTNRILLEPAEGKQSYIVKDFRKSSSLDDGTNFKTNEFHYIIFVRGQDLPTHYSLIGIDSSGNDIPLPDKNVRVDVEVFLEDERDLGNQIRKKYQVEKEMYTNYDSTFPYVQHLLD